MTVMLNERASGQERLAQLLPMVYDELRRAALQCVRGERPGHSLQATALVHEAYLKLVGPRELPWQSRAHFYAAAAQAMRRVVIDHARAKAADKRGGGSVEDAEAARQASLRLSALPDLNSPDQAAGFLILEAAICRLESVDPEAAEVVRLRYFAGLTIEQTAAALGVSAPTVKRSWVFARGWLKEAIESRRT